jgi:hypothetical protein
MYYGIHLTFDLKTRIGGSPEVDSQLTTGSSLVYSKPALIFKFETRIRITIKREEADL